MSGIKETPLNRGRVSRFVFDGKRNLPPAEVDRLTRSLKARGLPVPECECGCGESLIGRKRGTRWATDACRKRIERKK